MEPTTKTCARCGEVKSFDAFYRTSGRRHKIQSYCKSCHNIYTTDRFRARKKQAVAYLGGRCVDCKRVYPYFVYDFHHRDPAQKEFQFNSLRRRSWEAITAELDKCVLVCANCHRIRHWQSFDDEPPLISATFGITCTATDTADQRKFAPETHE